jgi:hypothetical protein
LADRATIRAEEDKCAAEDPENPEAPEEDPQTSAYFHAAYAASAVVYAEARMAAHTAADNAERAIAFAEDDESLQPARQAERAAQAALLHDIFGPLPFRPVLIPPAILAWNEGCIPKLAAGIYEERDFSQERMGVLADALEEAGVTDEEILGHCRGQGAVHCRGCWLVDTILAQG